jgi:hypothetical protein
MPTDSLTRPGPIPISALAASEMPRWEVRAGYVHVVATVGTVAERKGWMGNDLLNAFNTAVGAGIGVLLLWLVNPPLAESFTRR